MTVIITWFVIVVSVITIIVIFSSSSDDANKKVKRNKAGYQAKEGKSTKMEINTSIQDPKTNNTHKVMREDLSIMEQFVKTLFLSETLETVKKQFKSGVGIMPIDAFDISFRLLKTEANTINLEYLAVSNNGLKHFKPVGFYTDRLTVTVLNEYNNSLQTKGKWVYPQGYNRQFI